MATIDKLTDIRDQTSALLAYANGITGASDTRLGDAVRTLGDGYGGGGGLVIQKTKVGTVENRRGTLNQNSSNIGSFTVPTLDFDTIAFIAQDNSSVKIIPFLPNQTNAASFSYYWSKYHPYTTYSVAGYNIANRQSVDEKEIVVTYSRMTGVSEQFLASGLPFDVYIMKLVPIITKEE